MVYQIKAIINHFLLKYFDENGQTLIEYALLILLIAIVVIVALLLLGPQIASVFEGFRTTLQGMSGGG